MKINKLSNLQAYNLQSTIYSLTSYKLVIYIIFLAISIDLLNVFTFRVSFSDGIFNFIIEIQKRMCKELAALRGVGYLHIPKYSRGKKSWTFLIKIGLEMSERKFIMHTSLQGFQVETTREI